MLSIAEARVLYGSQGGSVLYGEGSFLNGGGLFLYGRGSWHQEFPPSLGACRVFEPFTVLKQTHM